MTQAQAARRFGLILHAYRKTEAGEEELFDYDAYSAICSLFGWPQAFVATTRSRQTYPR
jgi:hypothetical protein